MLAVCIAALSVGMVTFARYMQKKENSEIADSVNFIFKSNYLKENPAEYTVYTGSAEIGISNYDGLNVTGNTITYTVEGISDNSAKTLTGGSEKTDTYVLSGIAGEKKTVTAKASSPFEKTLSAAFLFKDQGKNTIYKVTDYEYYITLDVYTGMKPGDITVSYDTNLAPDNTDARMANWTSGSRQTLSGLSPNAHYAFIFYGSEGAAYETEGEQILSGSVITLSKK